MLSGVFTWTNAWRVLCFFSLIFTYVVHVFWCPAHFLARVIIDTLYQLTSVIFIQFSSPAVPTPTLALIIDQALEINHLSNAVATSQRNAHEARADAHAARSETRAVTSQLAAERMHSSILTTRLCASDVSLARTTDALEDTTTSLASARSDVAARDSALCAQAQASIVDACARARAEKKLDAYAGQIAAMSLAEDGRRADRKSTRLNSSHSGESRMPSSA